MNENNELQQSATHIGTRPDDARVLIIDDEEGVLRMIKRFLVSVGYEVETATSGEEGLAAMQAHPFRVVLVDIKMPGMDGLDVLSVLRRDWPACEAIIISGHGEMREAIEALRRGAYNYLQKPLDLDELQIAIDRAFEKLERAARFREVQDQLYHAQKMEALGTLAGGVAHEFNNLMGGIIGYCDMALKSEGEDLPERALRISLKAANRASVIARNLLRFASRAEHRREPADLNTAVRDTVCLLQSDLESERIALQTDLQTLPAIRLDLAQMQQVFLNLVINARQALQDQRQGRRRIEIRTWCEGDRVCASVRDNGPGIPAEHLGRVTEPFFTTRGLLSGGEGGATGLGLSVVDGIVRGHGGELSVTSDPGEGTCFTLRLPHTEAAAATETPRVLLIDDDPAILRLLGAILEHHDCHVVGAAGGPEALERIRDESFSVAVLDYSMPGMDGVEVLRELQLLAPDLPVIMLTALHTPELAREAVLAGARECLAKPINNEKLLFLIRKYGAGDDTYEPKTAEPVATRQKHILVVDDDDTIRDVYGLVLARAGFRTTTVADQQEAVAHTEASYFDLIILDLLLPGADGQLLVRTLRANNPYTPIIISTSEASDHVLREGLNAGASRVLLKPVNPEGLVREVTHLMAIYQQQMPGV